MVLLAAPFWRKTPCGFGSAAVPAALVVQGRAAGGIGAEVVAGHRIAARARAGELDAGGLIAGDQVESARRDTADEVAIGPGLEDHARLVAEGERAGVVGAEEVALHHIVA